MLCILFFLLFCLSFNTPVKVTAGSDEHELGKKWSHVRARTKDL